MTDPNDRTVHATMDTLDGDHAEVVRYDKGGKWWLETTGTDGDISRGTAKVKSTRKPLSLSEAVGLVLIAHKSEHGQWFHGRPGGRTLDSRVRKAIETKRR